MLVDGVTKLDKVKYGESAQAETVRKMIVAMSRDIRVLLIKLADRLHNARTWGFVPPEKAQKKATETLEIYAPLAHRLGIQTIKSELEDLSFAVLHPKLYAEIESLVKQRTPQREEYVQNVIDASTPTCASCAIRGRVMGRPKQLYSVYQKMVVRGREFDDIYDLIGIRMLVKRARLLRRARRDPRALDAAARPVQGLHRDAEVQPVPVAAHDGASARAGARSRSRSARTRCTSRPSTASRRTGSTRSR